MAKKKKEPEVIQEEEIIEEEQDIELYEIDERYGITPDGVVYDVEKETALVPVLDDIGRPCVKINRKRIPIDELKRKYLPGTNESVTSKSERSEDRVGRMSDTPIRDEINEHNNYNSKPKSKNKDNLNNFKLKGEKYKNVAEASIALGISENVLRAFLINRKRGK